MSPTEPPQIPGLAYVQRLGSGGFADVHLYRQELPRMLVAVKVLHSAATDLREQLVAEANTMAELAEHPYIVTVLRADVADDGRPYLVMSYYPRPNLSVRARQRALPVSEALRTGVQLASAVETAHRAGVLHRDIKPANVLVSSYGAPALADFGIAGRAAEVDDHDDVGVSVAWSPPEVLRGSSNGSVAADVYSLSATIAFLLSGRTPFEQVDGDNSGDALVRRTLGDRPRRTDREDVPESLERLLQAGMAKNPARRPGSALALGLDLQRVEQELRLPRTELVVDDDEGWRDRASSPVTTRASAPRTSSRSDASAGSAGGSSSGSSAVPPPAARLAPSEASGGSGAMPADPGPPAPRAPHGPPPPEPPGPGSGSATTGPTDPPARRRSAGVVVAAVAAAALLLGGGVAAAMVLTDDPDDELTTDGGRGQSTDPSSTDPSSTDPSSDSGSGSSSDGSTAGGEVDPCLVGTWEAVSNRQVDYTGAVITGMNPTTTVSDDGTVRVEYDQVETEGADLVLDGVAEYRISTDDGRVRWSVERDDVDITRGGEPDSMSLSSYSADYTCADGRWVEDSGGSNEFRAIRERTS
ncbi:hypothetical protein GCM10027055_28610 [Janibacter alkaliphilus]|uniref:non-specific serine/threonine protein kinase n=1 Tax=Janibacter alkaliphilus TaxID=1069963 RepID=A0A852X258_9MICO|nr:serine/threonine-protein kinase [Janibacter alkaliphilus]NYG36557.1 serine/threonine protein kinase [Janibacter alkaliphilus]